MNRILATSLAVALLTGPVAARATAEQIANAQQLADLTLEQLANIEVTSVSGRAERLQQAAASIYVITGQEIRRSAASSLPEALRLAPNLQVAQTSAGQWAISARGFQDSISNKLLVLVDGRTLYSVLFAGVFWDANDVVLEDVDRIEVISGPGGTLWGANAVNGVINIVTRSAAQTQGPLVSVTRSTSGGREVARWGTRLGEADVRLYGLTVDRGDTELPDGTRRADSASRRQAGFRSDWSGGVAAFTLQGDVYSGGKQPTNNLAPQLEGFNLLGRWSGRTADDGSWQLQAYFDAMERDDTNLFRNRSRTVDLQFSRESALGPGRLLWGAGHRRARDENQPTLFVAFVPETRTLASTNAFAQYQWALSEQLQVTGGVKAERHGYGDTELLPSLRVAWLHSPRATTWAAVSRAVRAPSRVDRDLFLSVPGLGTIVRGGPDFRSETAKVLELGHRAQFGALSGSVTVFRQDYQGLRAGLPGEPLPATVRNLVDGSVDGIEAWARWQATDHWRLSAGWLGLHKDLRYSGGLSPDTRSFPGLGDDPRSQLSLRSSLDVGASGEFDVTVRRVGELTDPLVPAYTAVDARWGLQVSPTLTLSVLGTNLLDKRHVEFNGGSEIRRRVFLQASWQL